MPALAVVPSYDDFDRFMLLYVKRTAFLGHAHPRPHCARERGADVDAAHAHARLDGAPGGAA
jgi:hypothetical protein